MAERTVTLPCEVGDEVYAIRIFGRKPRVCKTRVREMYFTEGMRLCIVTKNAGRGEWMKGVFPTQEAAEAYVEGLQNA